MKHSWRSKRSRGILRLLALVPIFAYGTELILQHLPKLDFTLSFSHLLVVYGLFGLFVRAVQIESHLERQSHE